MQSKKKSSPLKKRTLRYSLSPLSLFSGYDVGLSPPSFSARHPFLWIRRSPSLCCLSPLSCLRENTPHIEETAIPNQRSLLAGLRCWIDGSFSSLGHGGVGYILKLNEELVQFGCRSAPTFSTFHMEALALLIAIRVVLALGNCDCMFFTASLQLLQTLLRPQPISVDLHSHFEIMLIWSLLGACKGFSCMHVSRDNNTEADSLAKMACSTGECYEGFIYPLLLSCGIM